MTQSITLQEIQEQPQVIRKLLEEESRTIEHVAAELRGRFHYVVIAARGTSDNAARYAQYLFGAYNRLPVALATPSLFTMYQQPPLLKGALVIGISQSGQSPDIVEVIRTGKKQGSPTLAITNVLDSPLAEAADYVIDLHAGQERAVAATKTYTASLCALALLSCKMDEPGARMVQMEQIPAFMEQTLANIDPLLERVERYRYMTRCVIIGRGFNYATAFEIALKIKELTHTVAEPYSSADFRHGPIAMVNEGFPVMVVAPKGQVAADIEDLIQELAKLDAELLIISDDPASLGKAKLALPVPDDLPEWATPLVAVLPGQLFAMQLAIARGLDPDSPRGLRKITETL